MTGGTDQPTARAVHFLNGEPSRGIDPADRGLAYGDGLFETMLCERGRIHWLAHHLERLEAGCCRLAIPLQDHASLQREIEAHLPARGDAVVKLVVTRGSSHRGYAAPVKPISSRILTISPWSGYPGTHYTSGMAVEPCALRLAENPQLAGLKHLCRLEQVLAQMELAGGDADEGLVRDAGGRVVSGITTNVFVVRGETLTTPALHRCGVRGVMRRAVLEQATLMGLALEESDVSLPEVLASDEIFMTNAIAGIRPVRQLGQRSFAIGTITRALMARPGLVPAAARAMLEAGS